MHCINKGLKLIDIIYNELNGMILSGKLYKALLASINSINSVCSAINIIKMNNLLYILNN